MKSLNYTDDLVKPPSRYRVTHYDSALDILAEEGYDPEYGARPLRRAIQTKVEDLLSDEIISGNIKAGDKITIGGSQGSITPIPWKSYG